MTGIDAPARAPKEKRAEGDVVVVVIAPKLSLPVAVLVTGVETAVRFPKEK